MQAFGIEIRKANASNLFIDVDRVLRNANIAPGGVSKELQSQAVAHALQNMIKPDHWFSICTIDDCIKVAGIYISAERYAIYRACHCLHWNEMLPDYRQTIIAMVLDDFRAILNP